MTKVSKFGQFFEIAEKDNDIARTIFISGSYGFVIPIKKKRSVGRALKSRRIGACLRHPATWIKP